MESQNPEQQSVFSSGPQIPLPNATAVLVLGIISIIGCFCYGLVGIICGIIALVLAKKDLALYKLDPGAYTPGSYSNLKSGRVCAIVGLSLSAIYLLVILIVLILFGTAALSHPDQFFNRHSTVMELSSHVRMVFNV